MLQFKGIREHALQLIKQFGIKVSTFREATSNLSGGNLQKVVVARELSHQADLLIAEQPTRGLDVGSIEFIRQQLIDYQQQGKAVLMISTELSEIMSLSDRILVMYEGQIVGEFDADAPDTTEGKLGLYMAGASENGNQ